MKRPDYFLLRFVVKVTGLFFAGSFIYEFMGGREPGFEMVFPASCVMFVFAMNWCCVCEWLVSDEKVINFVRDMKEDSK